MSKASNTLTVKVNDKEVRSNPFDFECYRIINNLHMQGLAGAAALCYDALIRMFEGTAANREYLDTLSVIDSAVLCEKLFSIYISAVSEINERLKNE